MLRKHTYLTNNQRCQLDLICQQTLQRRRERIRRWLDLLLHRRPQPRRH